ncbi:MAG: hypothetical protein ACLSVG_08685 [Clostridia bacterium]
MQSVYILLTRTTTVFSKLIHMATADDYTHISISADPELRTFYSFGRKKAGLPFPAGFILEGLGRGYFGRHPHTRCCLYELQVESAAYMRIRNRLREMENGAAQYKYSVLGILFCMMDLDVRRGRHYFCSQFVGDLLEGSGALLLPKPASLMRPGDYKKLPQLVRRYSGDVRGLLRQHRQNSVFMRNEMREERNAV